MRSARPILVVEDDHDVRVTLRAVLEEEGFAVITATNGRDALELLEREREHPGLILLDLMMPIMDGWQFAALLKAHATLAAIPFVVSSAVPRHDPPSQAIAILPKPLDLDALLELAQRYCAA
jgi:CheY-like chemotaxis protein